MSRLVHSSTTQSNNKTLLERQQAAYDYYRRQEESTLWFRLFGRRKRTPHSSVTERNVAVAWYAAAVVVGALGATYVAVPLYKVFCQTTGFGGTTQRVRITSSDEEESWWQKALNKLPSPSSGSGTRVHTWTDEEAAAKLATLKPVANADLITVRFDTTVNDVLPWSFVPVQLDVKVVPGETALSFFRVTNHSDKAITGVATYNVHPPKVGLYFQKIQCFCLKNNVYCREKPWKCPYSFLLIPKC